MIYPIASALTGFLFISHLATASPEIGQLIPRAPKECYAGEGPARLCYTAPKNTPQGVSVDDVLFAAAYLRSYGRGTRVGRFLTMDAADTPNCGEWSLYTHNTVQVTAKHLGTTTNSSVLFEDIATTLDGGAGANGTDAQKAASIVGCGTDGGSMGVVVNTTSASYNSTVFQNLYSVTDGILIKVVAAS